MRSESFLDKYLGQLCCCYNNLVHYLYRDFERTWTEGSQLQEYTFYRRPISKYFLEMFINFCIKLWNLPNWTSTSVAYTKPSCIFAQNTYSENLVVLGRILEHHINPWQSEFAHGFSIVCCKHSLCWGPGCAYFVFIDIIWIQISLKLININSFYKIQRFQNML